MPQAHFTISGRVQGVGFRVFVREIARDYGIEGAVWNTRDGNVEAVAEHFDNYMLDEFCSQLWNGPGRVSDIVRSEMNGLHLGPGFEIRPTI